MPPQTWRDSVTEADIRAIRRATVLAHRRLGWRRALGLGQRRAARLRANEPLTDVELRNEVTLAAAHLIGAGMEPDDAFLAAEQERDVHRFQAENADRIRVATDPEKDAVLFWLNDHEPDILRNAMDEVDG